MPLNGERLRAVFGSDNTLELTAYSNGCNLGLVGHYRWSLSPGGTLLHLAAVDDACTARSAALGGDWHADNCKDQTDVCWGDLEAGTYPTIFFQPRLDLTQRPNMAEYGAMTFKVPDGWAEAADHGTDVRLVRSADYATEGPNGPVGQGTGIEAWIRPAAVDRFGGCDIGPTPNAEDLPDALVGSLLYRHAGLVTGTGQTIDNGLVDGHRARWIEVDVAPDWTATCGRSEPTVPLITEAVGNAGPVGGDPYRIDISGTSHYRLIFVDLSQNQLYARHTAMILITAPDRPTFDAFVNEAMQIVESFHFK